MTIIDPRIKLTEKGEIMSTIDKEKFQFVNVTILPLKQLMRQLIHTEGSVF